jgi:diguanylate cyclase (GGDEF)-like protein
VTTDKRPHSDPQHRPDPRDVLPSLLVVTTDSAVLESLCPVFEARGRRVTICATETEAIHLLRHQPIAAAIVDLVLPGHDGRRLIVTLRSDPATAALPIVAVGPLPPGRENSDGLVHDADLYFSKPVEPTAIADGVGLLLKRGCERGRKSYRDALTGLPNRAAFCETYERIARECAEVREPLSLAILGIHRFDELGQGSPPPSPDDLIRQVGASLSTCFRATDIIARWGLAEFAVLLPGEARAGAARAMEKALKALDHLDLPTTHKNVLRFCTGLAVLDEKTPIANAVGEAERQLFQAYSASQGGATRDSASPEAERSRQRPEHIAICVVDGNMGRALSQMLEREHFTTRVFLNVNEAAAALGLTQYHLLIADDAFAPTGDTHLLERIRAIPRCSNLRIIMLVSNEAGITRALELGANDYALKPPDIASFLSRVRRILATGAAHSDRVTVMIIDHEIPQLMIAGTTLSRQCGCKVLLAHGAADALQRLGTLVPDYLILDVDAPELRAPEFLNKLAAHKGLKIISAASPANRELDIQHVTLQFLGRVARPYKPDSLIAELQGVAPCADESPAARDSDGDAIEGEIRRMLTRRQ